MHICLTLSHASNHPYLERDVFRLIAVLESYCDSIQSCDMTVGGPSGEGATRCWDVELTLRIFDETVRAAARAPEGRDPQLSLARVLSDVYAKARSQLTQIAEQHHALLRSLCARREVQRVRLTTSLSLLEPNDDRGQRRHRG